MFRPYRAGDWGCPQRCTDELPLKRNGLSQPLTVIEREGASCEVLGPAPTAGRGDTSERKGRLQELSSTVRDWAYFDLTRCGFTLSFLFSALLSRTALTLFCSMRLVIEELVASAGNFITDDPFASSQAPMSERIISAGLRLYTRSRAQQQEQVTVRFQT